MLETYSTSRAVERGRGTTEPGPRASVVLLEDVKYELQGIASELNDQADIEFIAGTDDPEEVFALVATHHPDVVIIDLQIYDDYTAGLRALKRIKDASPRTRCLVFTNHFGIQYF